MLYPHSKDERLTAELFNNPGSEYRGTPFWSWNNKLDEGQLCRQIDMLKAMGMGGFHMHSRTGMATPYLSDEFMNKVKACVEKARKEKMLAWLYDEDRWPSGAAGGIVTREDRFRGRYLLITPTPYGQGQVGQENISASRGGRGENGKLLARYAVALDESGCLGGYRRLAPDEQPGGPEAVWYVYVELQGKSPWYNNESYVDTLNPEAIKKFVQVTHERYKQAIGGDFGGVVPAIFTDEPQFTRKASLGFASEKRDINLPWTDDFPATYKEAYGADVMATLPELLWNLPDGKPSLARYRYHDHVSERFAQAFADTVGNWCRDNGIALTGHMMEEVTLESQTNAIGDCMRSYRSFQLPGIDILCDRREFTTAKQAQSAANQYGWPGVLSELYGVTGWEFDFRGHKLQGDWQAALGVTVRVQHLTWVSMAGEAKRDYPASIGYQSPWWREYPAVEDHFARLNTALTRGKNAARVAVVHPVESYWVQYGPKEQTGAKREALDHHFSDVTNWLLQGMIDFDFLCESTLPAQCKAGGAPLRVGEMAYDAVVVPQCDTLRATTLERLEAFQRAGGTLVFLGAPPTLCDAQPSPRAALLAEKSVRADPTGIALLHALEDVRMVDVRESNGLPVKNLLHQLRNDGSGKWLFLCQAQNPASPDVPRRQSIAVRVRGSFAAVLFDTLTGQIAPVPCTHAGGWTLIDAALNLHDSLLYRLEPASAAQAAARAEKAEYGPPAYLTGTHAVTLDEPNVLLLDVAEYRFDGGDAWQAREELLRIDNQIRRSAGYPLRQGHVAQPWVVPDEPAAHTAHLRFIINSETALSGCLLACENAQDVTAVLNGQRVTSAPSGFFTDESIMTRALPALRAGENELLLSVPVSPRMGLEWCYLLGDFGVRVEGTSRTLTPKVTALGFGDYTAQGLPYYGGNVTYHVEADLAGASLLTVPQYRGGLLTVAVDGGAPRRLIYAPYQMELNLPAGRHRLDITCYGHRYNCFGAVHNCNDLTTWHGPGAWRTEDEAWSYEYRLRRTGVLVSPMIQPRKG